MKLHGQKVSGPNMVDLYLPRGDDKVIHIRCQAVLNYDDFHKLCPSPIPPTKILRGGAKVPDLEHPNYKAQLVDYGTKKTNWMLLQSIKATPGLEWETVDLADASTWDNWQTELSNAGFSDIERQRILNVMMEANALNEGKLEEARERFLSGQLTEKTLQNESTSQNGEPKSTPVGEPASVSVLDQKT